MELSKDVAFRYDLVRGGVNQLWNGRIDLLPTVQVKINEPAKIVGLVFYRETLTHSVRLTNPDKAAKVTVSGGSEIKPGEWKTEML